jgi:hypothetical protein
MVTNGVASHRALLQSTGRNPKMNLTMVGGVPKNLETNSTRIRVSEVL